MQRASDVLAGGSAPACTLEGDGGRCGELGEYV